MAKKVINWKTKGMNRDLSVSAFSPEFAFENKNLRLLTNEGNTLLSWVNEKGTSQIKNTDNNNIILTGTPIGTAVLNNQLVVFTHGSGSKPDYIYLLKYSDTTKTNMVVQVLYNGNLNFSVDYPLETLVSYEADYILKVYWTDGINLPRVINIAATAAKKSKWRDTSFNFVPEFSGGKIHVKKNSSGGGLFAPGIIQYCFTYINKYGQQTNIVDISPIYYLSFNDRGASPEEKVTNSFTITISEGDSHFDYIRLYSILRTSLDATPVIKILEDIKIEAASSTVIYEEGTQYNAPLTLTYNKGNYPDLVLPVDKQDSAIKIESVLASDGTFTVNVIPKSGTEIFDNDVNLKFAAIADESERRDIISLLDLIKEIVDNLFYSNSSNSYHVEDYYAYIEFNQTFKLEMLARAEATGNFHTLEWQFEVNGAKVDIDYNSDLLLYSFASKNWYVVSSTNAVSISTIKNVTNEIHLVTGGSIYTDNGTTGAIIDPTELLYVGGHEISALTMSDKDNTLFLGNCTLKNMLVTEIQNYFDNIRDTSSAASTNRAFFYRDGALKNFTEDPVNSVYYHKQLLGYNNRDITTFKAGDTYRLGFQLLKHTGEWVEPVFMNDVKNLYYPLTTVESNGVRNISLAYAKADIDISNISGVNYSLYKSIRPVIVFPTVVDREVLCLGVLNPTVFNSLDRIDNYPYAMASWYFRPYTSGISGGSNVPSDNITKSIILTRKTDSLTTDIEPRYFVGKTTQVYVAVVKIEGREALNAFIKKGSISVQKYDYEKDDHGYILEDHWDSTTVDFWGAIVIHESLGIGGQLIYEVALLKSTAWEFPYWIDPKVDDRGYTVAHSYTYLDCEFIGASPDKSFHLYNKMPTVSNNLLYYTNPEPDDHNLDEYHFKFYITLSNVKFPDSTSSPTALILDDDSLLTSAEGVMAYCDVTFKSIDIALTATQEFNSLGGSLLRFEHYDHIFTRNDMANTSEAEGLRAIEILNAIDLYGSPFMPYDETKVKSNTEFFIDLSIVTLNSPDIDFNSDVQTYGNDALHLRIVGAIPITACASAHDITTSSGMLEFGHNYYENDKVSHPFGMGELKYNVWHSNKLDGEQSKRLVADLLWNDAVVKNDVAKEDKIGTLWTGASYLIHPWHRTGSLNNDWRVEGEASSWLKTKKESNQLYSLYTEYLQPSGGEANSHIKKFPNIGLLLHLTENDFIINYRMAKLKSTSSDVNYYPNVDKVLYNGEPYEILPYTTSEATKVSSPVWMRFKSTSHAVIALMPETSNGMIPILPYGDKISTHIGKYTNDATGSTFWGNRGMLFAQESISSLQLPAINYDFLWLGEIYKEVANPFGGKTDAAVRTCTWLIGGEAVPLTNGKATIYWTEGDTYFQRYDCMKTYPFSNEDPNLLVEILSFMCETHVNIDGRYDKNRGLANNTSLSPKNFNILNPTYSLEDDYFTAKKLDLEDVTRLSYPNLAIFSKTKSSGADIDLWTNMTLANNVEFDGDKGEVKSLQRFDNLLLCFQDTGISLILYNENVLLTTENGVPVEIANSGKVQGKRYISNTVGCSNKWSICNTPSGIYFMDSHGKDMYLFNGKLLSLSTSGGFNTWSKKNIPVVTNSWTPMFNPVGTNNLSSFITHYDKRTLDIMWINKDTALAWNEKLGVFTSFYDYGGTPWFCNLEDTGIWITKEGTIWKHRGGEYCKFFGVNKSFWTVLVGNPEPTLDKTFTNLEFRACVEGEGSGIDGGNGGLDTFDNSFDYTFHPEGIDPTSYKYVPYTPFDYLETWNEYQHGIANLSVRNGHALSLHHTGLNASLNRKFRIWRCDIPRNNYPMSKNIYGAYIPESDSERGIYRKAMRPTDRMRNPWLYLKLLKNAKDSMSKVEIHDIEMTYFL